MTNALPAWVADVERRARSLFERLEAARAVPTPDDAEDLTPLAGWMSALAPGDPEAFVRRLSWDGLDPATVARSLRDDAPDTAAPPWTVWLERFSTEALAWAEETPERASEVERVVPAGAREPAFIELWAPLVRVARTALAERAGAAVAALSIASQRALAHGLRAELAGLGEMAAHEMFDATRDDLFPSASSKTAYRAFTHGLLAEGLRPLLTAYPVLARHLALAVESWVTSTSEVLLRLESDREALAQTFGDAEPLGPAREIEASLSDRHHGGRRVAALTLVSGRRLIYKPRDVGLERAFHGILSWASARGLDCAAPSLRVLARPDYGWVEFAEHATFATVAEVDDYFRRAGALFCFVHLLRGRDLHMDNVIATRRGPVIVDAEALVQPVDRAEHEAPRGAAGDAATARLRYSSLATGLLSFLQTDALGAVHDIGGLRGTGGQRAPRRVWHDLRTDAIRFASETLTAPGLRNRVLLDGREQRPEDHTEALADGFARAYRFLLAHREELVSAGGPLAAVSSQHTRVVFRPSHQYAALQHVLASPRYQRAGTARSFALDSINRVFSRQKTHPALWPLVRDERASLEELDIPRFVIATDTTTPLASDGSPVEGHFVRAGLDAVKDRLGAMSEQGLADELEIIATILTGFQDEVGHLSVAPARDESASTAGDETDVDDEALVAMAVSVGEALLSRAAAGDDGGLSWVGASAVRIDPEGLQAQHDLYDGTAGVALFLAALAAVTGQGRWSDAARGAVRTLARDVDADVRPGRALGACSGLGSRVWALRWTGRLLGDEAAVDLAFRVARHIVTERIGADRALDVSAGAAGAALGLLALHAARPEPWLVERAVACGEHLVAQQVETGPGRAAWPTAGGLPLAGFAHGASGIAAVLARLFAVSGNGAFRDAVLAAWRHERGLFSAREGNWPVLTANGPGPVMTAWCHGAPGVGLGRALSLFAVSDDEAAAEVDLAMTTTAGAPLAAFDHVCCGNLGRADVLITVGRTLGRDDFTSEGRRTVGAVAARARARGRFAVRAVEFEGRAFRPGFFQGLSGIGYGLLRGALPARLPSVLGFQDGELP